jgi:hypothetical protein
MSFDVSLEQNGRLLQVSQHAEGGTYVMGGTTDAALNITYNYGPHYYEHLNTLRGLRWLDGKRAQDTIGVLASAIGALGIEQDADYWASTPGNAGYALSILLEWAAQHPMGLWRVS